MIRLRDCCMSVKGCSLRVLVRKDRDSLIKGKCKGHALDASGCQLARRPSLQRPAGERAPPPTRRGSCQSQCPSRFFSLSETPSRRCVVSEPAQAVLVLRVGFPPRPPPPTPDLLPTRRLRPCRLADVQVQGMQGRSASLVAPLPGWLAAAGSAQSSIGSYPY